VITWRVHIARPPDVVYAALDDAHHRARFWAERAEERGGFIHFIFINGVEQRSRILHKQPPAVWAIEYFGAPCVFNLEPDGHGGTDVRLTHDAARDDEWNDTYAGWLNVLLPLKAWVQYGIDLRNHDRSRTWDQRYVDQ